MTSIVAELTGYPAELLEPDLDLEADLGVDTVKQAEVFAAVRGHYGVERDADLKLRDFPTLRHVAGWVRERVQARGPGRRAGGRPGGTTATATPRPRRAGRLRAIDALPRRVPVPSLRPGPRQCRPSGVALDGARVVVMADAGGVARRSPGSSPQPGRQRWRSMRASRPMPCSSSWAWQAQSPIHGVYWLPALDAEGDQTLVPESWREALRRRVHALYATMRQLGESAPFLVTATRLGGQHGYDAAGAHNPMGGAVVGFAKSYHKERPDAFVKAVDVAARAEARRRRADADRRDAGRSGLRRDRPRDEQRFGVAFVEVPFPRSTPAGGGRAAAPRSAATRSFVVTGAAGSIVSAIIADLAAASGGTFHLLDLTPAPDAADADIAAFRTDRDGLKATLAERLKAAGGKPTPVAIERELARLERQEAALSAVQAVEAAGGTAIYHAVDLTDAQGGRPRRSTRCAGRTAASTCCCTPQGSRSAATCPTRSRASSISSSASRPTAGSTCCRPRRTCRSAPPSCSRRSPDGSATGQTDYSAANDLLCKNTSHLRRTRPDTRALALDWTAWGGIGMATRGSIPKIMEMAGVQMLPPRGRRRVDPPRAAGRRLGARSSSPAPSA